MKVEHRWTRLLLPAIRYLTLKSVPNWTTSWRGGPMTPSWTMDSIVLGQFYQSMKHCNNRHEFGADWTVCSGTRCNVRSHLRPMVDAPRSMPRGKDLPCKLGSQIQRFKAYAKTRSEHHFLLRHRWATLMLLKYDLWWTFCFQSGCAEDAADTDCSSNRWPHGVENCTSLPKPHVPRDTMPRFNASSWRIRTQDDRPGYAVRLRGRQCRTRHKTCLGI